MLSLVRRRFDLSALMLVLICAAVPRILVLLRAPTFITNDSLSYLLPAYDLASGESFDPLFKRPPGYSLFLATVFWTMGRQSLEAVLLLQHGLGVAIALLSYVLGRLLFGRLAGLLAGLLTAVSGPLLVTEHYLMSETLFALQLTIAVLLAVLALRHRHLWLFAAAGMTLGIAALTRPVAQMMVPVLATVCLFYLTRRRQALLAVTVLVASYGATVLPWMARNAQIQHSFTLAGGLGEGLAVRTIRYGQEFEFRAPRGSDDPLKAERKIYRDEAEQDSVYELARRLREELELSSAAADRAMRDIALQAIVQKPGYYLLGSGDMFLQMFAGRPIRLRQDWQPWRGIVWEDRVKHLLPALTPEHDRAFGMVELLVTLYDPARWSGLIAGLFVVGCLASAFGRDRVERLAPAVVAVGLLLASAYLVGIEWRYRYPLDPLIHVMVGGGVTMPVGGFARRLAARRRGIPLAEPPARVDRARPSDDGHARPRQGPASAES